MATETFNITSPQQEFSHANLSGVTINSVTVNGTIRDSSEYTYSGNKVSFNDASVNASTGNFASTVIVDYT